MLPLTIQTNKNNLKISIMKNSNTVIVEGELNKLTHDVHVTWECPTTGDRMWVQGELYYNKSTNAYEHDVVDEDGVVMYTVTAK